MKETVQIISKEQSLKLYSANARVRDILMVLVNMFIQVITRWEANLYYTKLQANKQPYFAAQIEVIGQNGDCYLHHFAHKRSIIDRLLLPISNLC